MPRPAPGLLVAGTTSDAGKTLVVTGLCRALARRGVDVAPYKAQNMSNNSMVCPPQEPAAEPAADHHAAEHTEIGRAQWVQALAAGVTPGPDLNPVLLKPGTDRRSHVVRDGRPAGTLDARDFTSGREPLQQTAYAALDRLRERHEVVVVEGAGSPAEVNLRAHDYVNMGLARHAGMPAVVVGDIDRGGVFASCYGTVALLDAGDQALLSGFVVNKFRGDRTLLQPGLAELERLTGRQVYGVLPWHPEVWLDSEDALDVPAGGSAVPRDGASPLRVAVVRFPRISNFTDVDALALEPGVEVRFVSSARGLADADLVVLPGSRATLADLAWAREQGLDRAVAEHAAAGRPVLGICGGCQMLGERIEDPDGVEGSAGSDVEGLGLLPLATTFAAEKVLGLPTGTALGETVTGYEIHHGRLRRTGGEEFLDGVRRGPVSGTLWHGTLEGDGFRAALLREVAATVGAPPPELRGSGDGFAAARERRLDLLGDLVEEHLDVDGLLGLARDGAPAGMPLLTPGAAR